jgi:hypothetical protein
VSTELRTYKQSNRGLMIAVAIAAVVAVALAFYLTKTGHNQQESALAAPAAQASLAA